MQIALYLNHPYQRPRLARADEMAKLTRELWANAILMSDRHATYLPAVLIGHHDRMAAPLMVVVG
jgi:hypothetical protein